MTFNFGGWSGTHHDNATVDNPTYYVDANCNFGVLDIDTGARQVIRTDFDPLMDIAGTPSGELYGVSNGKLYSIDPSNGNLAVIGSTPSFTGFGASDDGLYGVTGNKIYTVNPQTGAATQFATLNDCVAGDLVVVDNALFISTTSDQLVKYDLATGQQSVLVNNLPGASTYGIAVDSNGDIVGVNTSDQGYRVDVDTGAVTLAANVSGSTINDMAGINSPASNNSIVVDGENSAEIMNPDYNDANAPTNSGGDIIDGADGVDDVILGNGGNDTINAGLGNDEVYGGSGDDSIDGGAGNDVLTGDFANNVSDVVVDNGTEAGDDTINGGAGNDIIYGDNGDAPETEVGPSTTLDFSDLIGSQLASENGAVTASVQLSGFSNITSNYTAGKYTPEGGLFSGEHSGAHTADFTFDNAVSDVSFTLYDINQGHGWDDQVQIIALDADGNQVPVNFSGTNVATGGVEVRGDTVDGNDNNTTYRLDSNNPDNVQVSIAGPITSLQIIHEPGNDTSSKTGWMGISDITVAPVVVDGNGGMDGIGGDDIITGGEGADQMFGEGGNDTFIVGSETEGAGDVIVGGNGPDQNTDNDVLDLRGAGIVTIDDAADENDAGARAGTVTFENGSTLEFSQIETILQDDLVLTITPATGTPTDGNGNPVTSENGDPVDVVITRNGPLDQPLVVTLGTNDPSEIAGPQTVTIPAGVASITVSVTPVDDTDVDGTQFPTITVSAPNFTPFTQTVTVQDDDVANQNPDAVDDQIGAGQAGPVVISPATLLGNDSDPDGDALQGVSVQDPENGTVTFDGTNVIFTPTVGYAGPASFTYTISDGKGGFDTAKVDLVVDGRNTPDAPNTAPDMTAPTDTGISDTDDLTNDTTPDFAIVDPGDNTPNLYVNGEKVPSTFDPNTNVLTPDDPLPEGPHAVSYTLTSPQGKESGLSPNLPILIDATAPQTPVNAPDMTPETDTGIKSDDDDTDDRTPSFKVGEIGDNTPALYVDGVKVPATYDAANGTLTPNTPIADGPHEVTYTLTDPSGNESTPSPKLPIMIGSQNQAPEAVDDMIAVNYVGPVEIDISTLLSNDIDVDGDKLQGVSVQDAQNGSVEVQGDKLIFTPESGFEGMASFTYTVSDGKGGIDTATVNLNINISAPDAPANAPDMTAATDTGISDTDDLTKLEMPDFAIANPGDHIVTLYIDGTPYPAEYNPAKGVIAPIAALEDGQYQISYTLKDPVTGKESAMSPVLLIEVDNDIYQPLTPVDMTDETDTGMSNTDNITSDSTPDFTVEVPDNSTPSLIVDGVKVEAIYDADKGTLTPKSPLVDGPHEVSYSLMDAAGNESAPSPALTVVIGEVNQNQNLIMNGSFEDVTGLAETFYGFAGQGEVPYWTDSKGLTIDIHNDQRDGVKPTDGTNWADLGGLNSDNRIGQNVSGVVAGQSYKLEFDAGDIRTADDGKAGDNLVTVYWGGEAIATINPPDGSMSHYEFNLIGGAGNGSNRLEFAGSGKLDNFGVSIDKISLVSQANTTLTAADMTAQSDSGISDADNLTNVGTPGFVIEATDGRTPILYVDGKPVETTFDVDTSTVTPVNPLPEGPHQISYKLVDGLGNESPLSQPLNIMIDTQAPQINGVADMIDASDDGVSNQDDITTETKPSFAIEPAGENIPSLYVDGVKVPASYDAKNGTLTPVEPLSLGNHAISYSLTDPAGNESAPSLPLPIEIKTAFDVPQENKAPDAQDDVIVGEQDHAITISPSELLGNDSDPDGDSLQGVSLQDPVNGTVYFDGQNVIFTPTAGYSGPASFTYTITDGKGGFDTATVNLVVDAIAAPATPSSPLDMTAETDTGVSNTDNITGDTTPSFTIENLGINTPNLYVDGVKVASNFAFGVLTPVDPIVVGHHEVTYTLTNPAGKESAQSPALPIEIQVVSVNSNPNAVDDDITAQSGVVVIAPSELLANDVDENGDTLQGVSLQDAVNGTVSFDGQNVIFTPTDGYTGPASFTYTVTDGKGGFDTATVNLTIASPSKEGIIDFNDYQPNVNSAPPAGWFTDNPGGMIEVLPSDVYGIPGEVTNVLELERYKGDASNFYTFVNSKAGETITLDFDYSARSSATWSEHSNSLTASGANTTSAVHILVNGAIFQTIDTNVVGFTHFSLAIPGTGDTMRIEFQAADKNEVGGLIDNIDLSATPIYLNGQPEGVQTPVMPDVPVVDDQTQHQPSNGGVKITVEGSDGDTHLQGTAGNDVINGGGTKDIIQAGAGDDVIYGNAGDDVISGGAGNDKMDGGVGADTFTWSLADTQGAGVEVDTVYNLQQNDAIDLKDLLNGETHDAQSLVNYLHFSVDGDKTTMYVSADGKFSEGNVDLANTTQQIEFVGVDLTAGGSMNDMQVIQSLLANHQLITD